MSAFKSKLAERNGIVKPIDSYDDLIAAEQRANADARALGKRSPGDRFPLATLDEARVVLTDDDDPPTPTIDLDALPWWEPRPVREATMTLVKRRVTLSVEGFRLLDYARHLRYCLLDGGALLILAATDGPGPTTFAVRPEAAAIGGEWLPHNLRRFGWEDGQYPMRPIGGGALLTRRDEGEAT